MPHTLDSFADKTKKEGTNEHELLEIKKAEYTKKNFTELIIVLKKCKKIIEAEEGIRSDISFKEISKIIVTKIFEEKRAMNGNQNRFSRAYLMQSSYPLDAFQKLFDEAKSVYSIYDESKEKIRVNLSHQENLLRIVGLLEDWSFSGVDEDMKGILYEIFLKASLRGNLGQYFTPKELVLFMINLAGPNEKQKILDPACGSGGFLIHSLLAIKNELTKKSRSSYYSDELIRDYLNNALWGFEIDYDLHLLAKINMIMHGGGFSRIHNEDFLSYNIDNRTPEFDIILTNPPFSFPVENSSVLNEFELGKGRSSEEIDILYVEKCLKLLKKDGLLAIVLPEGLLNLPSYQYFRNFVLSMAEILASISIPAGAFFPFGQSSAKTCILFLKKKGETKLEHAFMADAVEIGFEIGKKDYIRHNRNDLLDFAAHFHSHKPQIRTTEWGGRSAFVPQSMISATHLDAKYYFMQLYLKEIETSGVEAKKLSEIAVVDQPKIMPSKKPEQDFYYLEIPDISEVTGTIGNIRMLKGKYIIGPKVKFKAGDILFSRLYPDKNRIVIAPDDIKEGVCSQEIYIIRPLDPLKINPYVLLATLKSSMVTNQVKDLISGSSSSRPRLDANALKEILIPILSPEDNEVIAKKMKAISVDYWTSCQEYLKGYKEVMSFLGDDIKTNLIRKI